MRKKKNKKQTSIKDDPRDKRAERILYTSIIILAFILIIGVFLMSQEFS